MSNVLPVRCWCGQPACNVVHANSATPEHPACDAHSGESYRAGIACHACDAPAVVWGNPAGVAVALLACADHVSEVGLPIVHLHGPVSGPVCGATVADRATEQTAYRSEVSCPACLATLR